MHSLMHVTAKYLVLGRFCFAHAFRDPSETYRQRNINSKHTVHGKVRSVTVCETSFHWSRRSRSGVGVGVDSAGSESESESESESLKNQSTPQPCL